MKTRRRFVEIAKSTHCHIGRAESAEHIERAVRTAGDDSKIEITRRGGCVTIRTLEQREVPVVAPSPSLGAIMTLAAPEEPKLMAIVRCIGCGTEAAEGRLRGWHTGLVELGDVGPRTTAKIRLLHFCPCCEGAYRRLGEDMNAEAVDAIQDQVPTLDDRPAILAVPALMAR